MVLPTTLTMATTTMTTATKHLFRRFFPDPWPEKKTAEKLLYKVEITFLEEQTNPSGKMEREGVERRGQDFTFKWGEKE